MYLDNIILVENNKKEIDQVKEAFNKTFKIKDLGDLRYFLSFDIVSKKGITINQKKYVLKLLTDVDLLAFKPGNYSYIILLNCLHGCSSL